MTVSSQTSKVSYAGNGSTTVFSVPFYFLASADLKVIYRVNATGDETVKTLTTDYTVTGAGNLAGGSITATTAPATGITIVIQRNTPYTQEVDYQPNDPFPAATHELALDKLTMEVQQVKEITDRSIKLSATNTMTSTEFTVGAADRANRVLGFDSAGELSVAQELGSYRGNWATGVAYGQRDIIKDTSNANIYICIVAHTSTGAVPISTNTDAAKWALLVDAATATSASASATASAILANDWATKTSGPVAGGEYSAKYNAQQAATSSSSASSSASSASSSAASASSSASSATSSASAAASSASSAASSASAASSSAAAAAAAAASGLYRQVIDKSANYTIVAADGGTLFRGNTGSGAITFTLPQISTISDGFKVSIVKWTSDANPVNITRSGSDTINGATSAQIGSQYSQIILVADFETNTWFASQSGLGATNMNVDVFSGNGSTTAFTLSGDPGNKNNTDIYIGGVHQDHSTYSISGTTLTFTAAPPSGTSNIEVVYGTPLAVGTPSDGTVTAAKIVAGAVDLTTKVSGVLPAANGGTGLSSPGASGNVLVSNGTSFVSQAIATIPTGTIIQSGSPTAPSGYLACDGSIYNDSAYSALASAIGNIPSFRPTPFAIAGSYFNNNGSSVCFANGVVFSGNYYSTDSGANWTATTGTAYSIRGGGTGNMVFVSPYYFYNQSNGGYVYRTAFNVAGTAVTLAGAQQGGIASSGSRIWMVSSNGTASTIIANPSGAPGTTTAGAAATATAAGNVYYDVAYGNGTFVAVGGNAALSGGSYARIWTSADGSSLTARTVPTGFATISSPYVTISFVNNLFVITDQTSGSVASSSDGVTWTLTAPAYSVAPFTNGYNTAGPFLVGNPPSGNRVQYAGGIYFSGSYYSTDLINWAVIPPFQFQNGNGYYSYPTGPCGSDGTRMYYVGANIVGGCATNVNTPSCYFTPFNYTTSTQFMVPYLINLQSPGIYNYIKT